MRIIGSHGQRAEEAFIARAIEISRRCFTQRRRFQMFAMLSFVTVHIGFSAGLTHTSLWRCIANNPIEKGS